MAGLIPGFFVFAAFFAFLSYRKYVMSEWDKKFNVWPCSKVAHFAFCI